MPLIANKLNLANRKGPVRFCHSAEKTKQAEAEVVPSSSLVGVEVEVEVGVKVGVEVGVEVSVGIGGAGVGVGSLRWVVEDEVEGKHMSK